MPCRISLYVALMTTSYSLGLTLHFHAPYGDMHFYHSLKPVLFAEIVLKTNSTFKCGKLYVSFLYLTYAVFLCLARDCSLACCFNVGIMR